MPSLITRQAIGTINGTNKLFTTDVSYIAGTVQVLRNGQWILPGSWNELGGKKVFLLEAPVSGDIVMFQYKRL